MVKAARLVAVCVFGSAAALAQQSTGSSSEVQAAEPETLISPKQLVSRILHDQKPIWTLPAQVVRGNHWKPVAAVVAGTAALVVLDPHTEPYFNNPTTVQRIQDRAVARTQYDARGHYDAGRFLSGRTGDA